MEESEKHVGERVRRSMRDVAREALVSGLAVVVPLIVTAIVLVTALQYLHSLLSPIVTFVFSPITGKQQAIPLLGMEVKLDVLLVEILTPLVLLVVIFVVGLFVSTTTLGERAVDYFDSFISRIPAIGGIYDSFRQMSDVVLESDVRNFRDVKLVEFPNENTYTLGFVTTETPPQLAGPTNHPDMLTLFLPLAPNPVMGGHLVHVPRDKAIDVDMSVEEGIRAVVTSGVAVADHGGGDGRNAGLSESELRNLTRMGVVDERSEPESDPEVKPDEPVRDDLGRTREEEYRTDSTDPEEATTPEELEKRGRQPRDEPGARRKPDDDDAETKRDEEERREEDR